MKLKQARTERVTSKLILWIHPKGWIINAHAA
jgi:hypothetical protein